MSDRDDDTISLNDIGIELAAEPPKARPWSDEQNDLYVRVVEQAWIDLNRPDRERRDGTIASLALNALRWFQHGCRVSIGDGKTVSLFEAWDWNGRKAIDAAAVRYHQRPPLTRYVKPARRGRSKKPAKSHKARGTRRATGAGHVR